MYWLFAPQAVNRTWLVGLWCIGILFGIAVVKAGLLFNDLGVLVIGVALIIPALKRSRLALGLIFISGLLIGNWQAVRVEIQLRSLDNYIGQKVTLSGEIFDDPIKGDRDEQQFYVTNIMLNERLLAGKIRVSTKADTKLQRGDEVTVSGKLASGFGNYQARLGFAKLENIKRTAQPALKLRDAFAEGVRGSIPEPEASLGLGFLLGQRSALPEQLDEDLRRVGLTHIVVASGYNLTILVRAARRLLAGVSKFQAFAGSIALITSFVVITGFSPSMTRAALVTTLSLLAWYYGRRIYPLVLILFAAAVTAFINPLYLWSDLGWYLSFLAFVGVLMLAPLLIHKLYGDKQPSLMGQVAVESIAAQMMVVPVLLWLFGELSVFALIANLLVVPLIPLTMLVTFVAGVGSMLLPTISVWVGVPATLLISYMTSVTEWLSAIPWAVIPFGVPLGGMAALYVAAIVFGYVMWRKTKYDFLQSSVTD